MKKAAFAVQVFPDTWINRSTEISQIFWAQGLLFNPFGGAKPRPLGRGVKRRSGATLSKPQHLCWGVDGLTSPDDFTMLLINLSTERNEP